MPTITLEAGYEKLAPENSFPCAELQRRPLYHQIRTFEALQTHPVVMNTYNTGTGKTFASLLHLVNLSGQNVLFIAPTNALITQHTEDIRDFVATYNLDFKVLPVNAAEIGNLQSGLRRGETLYRLLRNYLEYDTTATRRQPMILVTNPDIFYYALYFQYGSHDRRNVFSEFVMRFNYLVVDEFHYYDQKQLANFLFAFTLFDQFGYFDQGRRVCLLSATPDETVVGYLDDLLGNRWVRLGSDNEPPESDTYLKTPTLTPLTLSIETGSMPEWAAVNLALLRDDTQDGALISSSLAQVNATFYQLLQALPETAIGRITGPESEADRQQATARRLILATPTVDIGYNFKKLGKDRQNIDYIGCDARFSDELIQRIGRAGRILGKPQTDLPSRATVLLSDEAIDALRPYDGQTLSRSQFKQIIAACEALPPKNQLVSYIRTYAVTECFKPIFEFSKMLSPQDKAEAEALFRRVCELFAPGSQRSFGGLAGFFTKWDKRGQWLKNKTIQPNKDTAEHIADWVTWCNNGIVTLKPGDITQGHFDVILGDAEQEQDLRDFVQSQYAITKALFSFRDSFQGPTAVIYDPQHLLSSQPINTYDIFHIIRNYEFSLFNSARQFEQKFGKTGLTGDFYVEIKRFRDEKLSLELSYNTTDDPDTFEQRWAYAPVALKGLRLRVRERHRDPISGGLDQQIVTALVDTPLPLFIVPPRHTGLMIAKLRGTHLWAYNLTVNFVQDGLVEEGYKALLGTAAYMAYAELFWLPRLKDHMKSDYLIL